MEVMKPEFIEFFFDMLVECYNALARVRVLGLNMWMFFATIMIGGTVLAILQGMSSNKKIPVGMDVDVFEVDEETGEVLDYYRTRMYDVTM